MSRQPLDGSSLLAPPSRLSSLSGDAAHGQDIFRQTCAFSPALRGPTPSTDEHAHRFSGALTDQEAWDLAAIIDRQERPAGPPQ